ncbi:hypothetical protein A2U01_0073483, partial [Trifolium medium]|nr:hypothetical protein [Trifolium medium]
SGVTRAAEWRNAPCFFCLAGFVLSLAQRAREVGATRSRCWGCPVFFWFLRCAQGGAVHRAGLVFRVDFC